MVFLKISAKVGLFFQLFLCGSFLGSIYGKVWRPHQVEADLNFFLLNPFNLKNDLQSSKNKWYMTIYFSTMESCPQTLTPIKEAVLTVKSKIIGVGASIIIICTMNKIPFSSF